MNAAGVIYEVLAILLAVTAIITGSSADSPTTAVTLALAALVAATLAVAHMLRGLVAVQSARLYADVDQE